MRIGFNIGLPEVIDKKTNNKGRQRPEPVNGYNNSGGSAQLRKQVVSFGDLTRSQMSRLKYFIRLYSTGAV